MNCRPQAFKEWFERENRRAARANQDDVAGSRQSFSPPLSLHRSSLHTPATFILQDGIEHKHHAMSKSLRELQELKEASPDLKAPELKRPDPVAAAKQVVTTETLPHLAHQLNFGWNHPTPQLRTSIMADGSHAHHIRYGFGQKFNHQVQTKAALITSRLA